MALNNFELEELSKTKLLGNVISQTWFESIGKVKHGQFRPDLLAINIYADIIYWHRPEVVKDENTNKIIQYKKRFKSDKLQRSYNQIADIFGVSKRSAKESIDLLRDLGLITTEFRTIKLKEGKKLNNVMFVDIKFDSFKKSLDSKKPAPSYRKLKEPPTENCNRAITENCNTYTETTSTEITTEILESPFPKSGFVLIEGKERSIDSLATWEKDFYKVNA